MKLSTKLDTLSCSLPCSSCPVAQSWRLTGDQYVEKGGKPWISEMYGYAFACAKSNVWHKWDINVMHYPTVGRGAGTERKGIPR